MQEVTLIATEPTLIFALAGEIDSKNADEFFETVMSEYRVQAAPVQFDCTALQFIDSTTLGTFVKIFKQVKSDGYNLRLTGLQPRLKKLFVICALDTVMEIA